MNERLHSSEYEPTKENILEANHILYLTKDPALIRHQIEGGQLSIVSQDMLLDNISTDEIIPNRACLAYTGAENGHLGNHALTGLRGNVIKPGEIAQGNFNVVVAGASFGRGSSRYHAPLALQEAGIEIVIADSERIFSENCVNAGIYLLDPKNEIADKLLNEKRVTQKDLTSGLSSIEQEIMKSGNLLKYLRNIEEGKIQYPIPQQKPKPMTAIEKIIAKKTYISNFEIGVDFVAPNDECIVAPDMYYGYELQTTVVRGELEKEFGADVPIANREKIILFNDHTALLTLDSVKTQQSEQEKFADKYGILNYKNSDTGAPAICHTKMLEDFALPGQLILGNDSHTCTLGALSNLAVGKGVADFAGAIAFDKMVVKVPETIRINLIGALPIGVTLKDFMLQFGAMPQLKNENVGSGRVLEFAGDALNNIPFDEQIKLTNMAVELQAFSGIIEPNEQMLSYLEKQRNIERDEIEGLFATSDENARYFATIDIDLSTIESTVATPGDAQNGRPLSEVKEQNIKIDKAYIGSCTHGTVEDLRQAAEVLKDKKISPNVKLYIQASSIGNRIEAEAAGYIQTLLDAGAELLPIGCGACMNAGPGATEEGEIGIFATNRNFPGRTGRGETYLANPAIVAASAIKGSICGPDDLY